MTDILIIGGHGKIALQAARLMAERGDRVTSVIRKPEQQDDVAATGATPLVLDVEHAQHADLVQAMLRVAGGEPLSLVQGDMALAGHAIEVRINAERLPNFAPCPGRITQYHAPGGLGVRMDSALYDGYAIPPNYDSLIGKICVHGKTREQAMAKMRVAMAELAITGIKTNADLHRDLFRDPGFADGGVSIHYLEHWLEERKAKQEK